MAWTPKDSRIKVDQSLEEKIAAATSASEISSILFQAMKDQNLVTEDPFNAAVLHEVTQPEPKAFVRTITETSTGRKLTFSGSTELELERSIGSYFRALQPARDSATGKFVQQQTQQQQRQLTAEEQHAITDKVNLENKFRRGEIGVRDYIQQSDVLADMGIDVDAVRELSDQRFTNKWVSASETFKQRHPEWQGGQNNVNLLGQWVIDNGLIDTDDPVAAMEKAFAFAKKNDLLVESPEAGYAREISECKNQNEVNEVNGRYFANSRAGQEASGFFNRR